MTRYTPGQPVTGCTVISDERGVVTLRCPCEMAFPVPRARVASATIRGWSLRCRECTPSSGAKKAVAPRTKRGAEALRLLKAGVSYGDVARATGMSKQGVERVWFRWVVLPRMLELEAENAKLRATTASLAERCAGQSELLSRRA